VTLQEQREERRLTMAARCEAVADLGAGKVSVAWCQLNDEADMLERIIPDAKQVQGSDSDEEKEETFRAFADGQLRVLITKAKIGGLGMNWQHCAHTTMFPSHSFEQYYQSIRRFYRFGQTRPVHVDIVTTEGELGVLKNLQRKAEAADVMFDLLVREMNNALGIQRSSRPAIDLQVPSWL